MTVSTMTATTAPIAGMCRTARPAQLAAWPMEMGAPVGLVASACSRRNQTTRPTIDPVDLVGRVGMMRLRGALPTLLCVATFTAAMMMGSTIRATALVIGTALLPTAVAALFSTATVTALTVGLTLR